jgi:predicted RNase H-like nuclease
MAQASSSSEPYWIGGADGIRDGWFVVLWRPAAGTVRRRVVDGVEALLALPEAPAVLGVDVVIGCPDRAEPGGRRCDRQARRLLGHPRGTSVFSPPAHDALGAETYDEAQRRNRASGPDAPGLSKQTFHLLPKMRAVAEALTPERQERVREVHPELAFYAMNGNAPVAASKHTDDGRAARADLLAANGFPSVREAVEAPSGGAVGADDVLDAHAACWTARRIRAGTAERCPPTDEPVPRNDRGLRMEIWR